MSSYARQLLGIRHAVLALAALLVAALLIAAVPADPKQADPTDLQKGTSLAGQLLVATPAMRDPRFDHAVILMVRHNRDGALGIVINHPLGERSLGSLLAAFGDRDSGATGNVRIFLGGPVQPEIGFVIHSSDYRIDETIAVDARVAVTSTPKVLRDIAERKGPAKSLIALGYAGWAPGQLEGELGHNVWYTAPQDPGVVFDDDRNKLWDNAVARRTQDL